MMPCNNNKYKHRCSMIVIVVSHLIGIMSLVTLIFGIMQFGMKMNPSVSAEQKKNLNIPGIDAGKGIGKANITIGVVGILIAVLGCATGFMKNPFFAIPYGVLTLFVGTIFLVIAMICMALASAQG